MIVETIDTLEKMYEKLCMDEMTNEQIQVLIRNLCCVGNSSPVRELRGKVCSCIALIVIKYVDNFGPKTKSKLLHTMQVYSDQPATSHAICRILISKNDIEIPLETLEKCYTQVLETLLMVDNLSNLLLPGLLELLRRISAQRSERDMIRFGNERLCRRVCGIFIREKTDSQTKDDICGILIFMLKYGMSNESCVRRESLIEFFIQKRTLNALYVIWHMAMADQDDASFFEKFAPYFVYTSLNGSTTTGRAMAKELSKLLLGMEKSSFDRYLLLG
jgi:hypothetical protein